jgi:ribosomal protein L24
MQGNVFGVDDEVVVEIGNREPVEASVHQTEDMKRTVYVCGVRTSSMI